ncbi:MAG: glycerol kinase GlpK [Proteobacteria bacterium]|nr:glycerol kinase GlpK [Pseudomonadota bacterium]MDA1331787.1 glycerol kinase GlpK [Pseudomonadota bacterium]
MKYLLALDQGTSSSRSIVFAPDGHIVSMAQQEFRQIYPHPSWVEHDPIEIWSSQLATMRAALNNANIRAEDIACIGITNQRETTVVWNRKTGQPIYNAIVWQDRRAEPVCAKLRQEGKDKLVQSKTGLVIDAYFSGTKLQWILNNVHEARDMAAKGELAFGTVDTWLIWNLTKGLVHATDVSNASRTMLLNVHTNKWDSELMSMLHIDSNLMPLVQASSSDFGSIDSEWLGYPLPIGGVAGDQQSALFGQACWHEGQAKNTYGTGCFMLMHTGNQFQTSYNGLITTSAAQTTSQLEFAFEGSVFIAGAVVQWLRDGLNAFKNSADIETLAQTVSDADGVVIVPAFTGLGAPYWNADARGTIVGITRGTTIAHFARAALDSIAFQSAALLQAMSKDAVQHGGAPVRELRVDGGACSNNLLMQIQADLLGIPVIRPAVIETTALGAAYLAGLQCGIFGDLNALEKQWKIDRIFEPQISRDEAQHRMTEWERAVGRAVAH